MSSTWAVLFGFELDDRRGPCRELGCSCHRGPALFFTADDWEHGTVLWAADLELTEASALDVVAEYGARPARPASSAPWV